MVQILHAQDQSWWAKLSASLCCRPWCGWYATVLRSELYLKYLASNWAKASMDKPKNWHLCACLLWCLPPRQVNYTRHSERLQQVARWERRGIRRLISLHAHLYPSRCCCQRWVGPCKSCNWQTHQEVQGEPARSRSYPELPLRASRIRVDLHW